MNTQIVRTESYKHQAAKETLASWIDVAPYRLNQFGAGRGGNKWLEYPIAKLEGDDHFYGINAWHTYEFNEGVAHAFVSAQHANERERAGLEEVAYTFTPGPHIDPRWNAENTVPTYAELLARGYQPSVVFDVAIADDKGRLCLALEVVHKHPVDERKMERLRDIQRAVARKGGRLRVAEVDAEWVLKQVNRPPLEKLISSSRILL
jgi:hypothetical protein